MKFKNKYTKNVYKKSSYYKKATIKYKYSKNIFVAVLNNNEELEVLNPYEYTKSEYIYSTPQNNSHEIGTRKVNTLKHVTPNHDKYLIIKKYWSTIKEGLKVEGGVIDNKFKIKY